MSNQNTISPKQLATAIGVSESSIKRWCDQGTLSVIRTAGGHRRIPINAAIDYVRKSGRSLLRPELLHLPSIRKQLPNLSAYGEPLLEHLLTGSEAASRQIAYELCVSHHSLTGVFDEVMIPVLKQLSFLSAAGRIEEYEAERAKTYLLAIISEVRSTVFVDVDAETAFGATSEGDRDFCSNQLAELALRHEGLNASSLGTSLSAASMCRAIEQLRPSIFWITVSEVNREAELLAVIRSVSTLIAKHGKRLLLCGPGLERFDLSKYQFAATQICSTYESLIRAAKTVR